MGQYLIEKLGNDVLLEMVLIKGGSFTMGAPEDEEGSTDDERPQHPVTVSPFFMGKYPITQAQWRFVAGLTQVNQKLNPEPSRFEGDNRPVESVSWYDAVEFCDRLCEYTKRPYRLPSEAEWEYACRAGTTTPFHFGETIRADLANYCGVDQKIGDTLYKGSYGRSPKGIYRESTTPVGSFKVANAFGLYDMHGNVLEWCADYWHDSYEGAPTNGSAWIEPEAEDNDNDNYSQLLRGGSWFDLPDFCRSANRAVINPDNGNDCIGLRVVCVGGSPRNLK